MSLLASKKILITGILSRKSIAYGIAKKCRDMGADLILTYQSDRFEERLREIAHDLGGAQTFPCDVTDEEQVSALSNRISRDNPHVDGLVHSIAYAPRESISGSFLEGCTRESFRVAHDVSSYSLIALTNALLPLMNKCDGSSVVALTYLGSNRAVPNYNTMGLAKASLEAAIRYIASEVGRINIRVNGISAGPIKTVAASGIEGFSNILKSFSEQSPLRRNVTLEDVGGAAGFLLSQLSSGITGEMIYVDCGYRNIVSI
ncbi:Enoyl-[acyl-carrier-protein] reductase [NADH] FabI [Candidatus Ichthyocystis hellenicum]|uniref:Enoyl-[acyl-carrier-protein] reductase [NADH] n=2 Tax=Burkholderiales genera incertae sedis TaxID=224471 RepID=A0A0S4M2U9_9BURK|nr:Enoyl-[acyl-carrier-protein] reductase [NADH] FabI [Candidatus Ichthyocystis hellenicum]